ncbi:hypothetical protein B0H34DRAFT_676015 [Crassisporium funariophilum]|nr:hypothetical protein B0H34DRAFT_676015 [Crassisporium funariophilum]
MFRTLPLLLSPVTIMSFLLCFKFLVDPHLQLASCGQNVGEETYTFKTSELHAIAALMYKKLEKETLPKLPVTDPFPYCTGNGDACFVCEKDTADGQLHCVKGLQTCSFCLNYKMGTLGAQDLLKHMGLHILYDQNMLGADNHCGLCLNTGLLCEIVLMRCGNTISMDITKLHCPNLRTSHFKKAKKNYCSTTVHTPSSGMSNIRLNLTGEEHNPTTTNNVTDHEVLSDPAASTDGEVQGNVELLHCDIEPDLTWEDHDNWDAPLHIAPLVVDDQLDVQPEDENLNVPPGSDEEDMPPDSKEDFNTATPAQSPVVKISTDIDSINVVGALGGMEHANHNDTFKVRETSRRCQKRRNMNGDVFDNNEICKNDGCRRPGATDELLVCKGPLCGVE